MKSPHNPFMNFRDERDLLLASRTFKRPPSSIRLPKALYGEITAWVTVKLSPDDLFSESGRLVFAGEVDEGVGWRLLISPHGYLTFEVREKDGFRFAGWIPLQAYFDSAQTLRLGLSLRNAPSQLLLDHAAGRSRLSKSTEESYRRYDYSSRLSLLIGRGASGPFVSCGDAKRLEALQLRAVPERIVFKDPELASLDGDVTGFEAYQTERYDMVGSPKLKRATALFPVTPGGGAFAPKWVDAETVQAWQQPEFCSSTSYWFYSRIEDRSGRLRRLRINPRAAHFNMMPTFFIRADRGAWRRLAPESIRMGWDGTEYGVDLRLSPQQAAGCWVACGIPFLETDRSELIEWARSRLGAEIVTLGKSVQGRPIELIRVGASKPSMHIALLFGQHSPLEIMAAHLIRPLLKEARRLKILDRVAFHIVPTVNVDCAHFGGDGLNASQFNTNRHWFDDIQPETRACIDYFDNLCRSGVKLDFAIDFHGGGTFRNHLIFYPSKVVGASAPKAILKQLDPWRVLLETHAGFRRCDSRQSPLDRLRASDYFIRQCKCPALIVELSSTSYFDPVVGKTRSFNPNALEIAGKGIARCIAARLG